MVHEFCMDIQTCTSKVAIFRSPGLAGRKKTDSGKV